MNYRYRIAFIGKRHIPDYNRGNGWLKANENKKWTPEFMSYKNIKNDVEQVRCKPVFVLYNEKISNMNDVGLMPNTTQSKGFNWKVWFNPNTGAHLLAHENSPKEMFEDEDKLTTIQNAIDERMMDGFKVSHLDYNDIGL